MPDPRPPGDDWLFDDVDWGEPGSRTSSEHAAGAPARQRSGLIPESGRGGGDRPPPAGLDPDIRRRRIAALAGLALLLGCAIVIPLVVLGGNGSSNSIEPPTTPVTTAPTTTTAPATTRTQPTTTTPTTTSGTALRVTLPAGTSSLKRGDTGAAVTQLQKGLVALGFSAGQPDGSFGATTEAAVVDFQQSNDLTPDGVAGADTVRLLNAALAAKAGSG